MRSSNPVRKGWQFGWTLASAGLLWACGGKSPAGLGSTTDLSITPGQGRLEALDDTIRLVASVRTDGQSVNTPVTWTALDPGIATVDGTGLVQAVSNGTARIRAAAAEAADTAQIVVQQVAATVDISPNNDSVVSGGTLRLTAQARDRKQFLIDGPVVSWSSADPLTATVDATGLVTGVSKGTTVISGRVDAVTGTSTIKVNLTALAITRDTTLQGTVTVTSFSISPGVQVALSGDFVLASDGPVTVAGTLQGDCRDLAVTGAGDLSVSGTIRNTCTDETHPGKALRLLAQGQIDLVGALVESSGEIEIANADASAFGASPRMASRHGPDPASTDLTACNITNSTIGAGSLAPAGLDGAPDGTDGMPGNRIIVRCDGDFTATGARFFGEAGGRGGKGTSTGTQPGRGGKGGRGGDVWLLGRGSARFSGNSIVFAQAGGRGGDAEGGLTTLPEALGGDAGDSGLPLFGFSPTGTLQIDPSGLDVIINSAVAAANSPELKRGGHAMASAQDGADATPAMNAEQGDSAKATGGKGGSVQKAGAALSNLKVLGDIFEITFPQNPGNLTLVVEMAGVGGAAVVQPGRGGNGILVRPRGGTGGNFIGRGGEGGSNLVLDNRGPLVPAGMPGKGGSVTLLDGRGGRGFNGCSVNPYIAGGQSGDGGIAFGATGAGGLDANGVPAERGDVIFQNAGNGEDGSDGAGPADGGAAGAFVFSLFGNKADDGTSFQPGVPGAGCDLPLDNTTKTVESDPGGHHPFDGGFDEEDNTHRARFGGPPPPPPPPSGNLRIPTTGFAAITAVARYSITIEGQSPWRTLSGLVFDDDTIRASAIAAFAGFPNVQFDLVGRMAKDSAGAFIGYDALLTVGGRGELPGGQPIVYRISARRGSPSPSPLPSARATGFQRPLPPRSRKARRP